MGQNFGTIKLNQNVFMNPSVFLVMNSCQETLKQQEQQKLKSFGIPDPLYSGLEKQEAVKTAQKKLEQAFDLKPAVSKSSLPKRKTKQLFKVEKVLRK